MKGRGLRAKRVGQARPRLYFFFLPLFFSLLFLCSAARGVGEWEAPV